MSDGTQQFIGHQMEKKRWLASFSSSSRTRAKKKMEWTKPKSKRNWKRPKRKTRSSPVPILLKKQSIFISVTYVSFQTPIEFFVKQPIPILLSYVSPFICEHFSLFHRNTILWIRVASFQRLTSFPLIFLIFF